MKTISQDDHSARAEIESVVGFLGMAWPSPNLSISLFMQCAISLPPAPPQLPTDP